MGRCVIVGSAIINYYSIIKEYLQKDDFFVYCDGGLKHIEAIGHAPDLIIGDFDSYENPHMDVETIVLPCEKDDTDTVYAVKECVKRGFKDFLLVGCIGERLDHTLGNISILIKLKELGLKGIILDDYSEMKLVSDEGERIEDKFSYFSLLSLSDKVTGVTIKGAKYPLNDGTIESGYQYGVSNEVIKGKCAVVYKKSGNLLLVKVF